MPGARIHHMTFSGKSAYKLFFLVIGAALLVAFLKLGSFTLFDVDEAVFAQASKEMFQGGDWITPTYNDKPRYDKPILIYWLMAASYKIFGVNEFGARFPSAIAGVLLAASLFLFMAFGKDPPDPEDLKKGLIASLSLIFSIYFAVYSHAAVTDMVLTFFISLSLFCFYIWSRKGGLWIYGFYAFSALALLTKGLIGILFPFGIAVIYSLFSAGRKPSKGILNWKAMILFLAIALPWHIAEYIERGREFFDLYIIKHHFQRFTEINSGHSGPFYFYALTLLAGFFPWVFFVPGGIKESLAKRKSPAFFALVWLSFILIFFSLSKTKLPNYVLPVVPPSAILVSEAILSRRWLRFSYYAILATSLALGAGILFSGKYLLQQGIDPGSWIVPLATVFFMIAFSGLYSILGKKDLFFLKTFSMAVLLVLILMRGLPEANRKLQGTLHKFSLYAGSVLGPDDKVICWGVNNPSIVFYSGRLVTNVNDEHEIIPFLGKNDKLLVISKDKNSEKLRAMGFRLLDSGDKYVLFEKD